MLDTAQLVMKQEIKLLMRSKWIIGFALLFATLALVITGFSGSGAESGYTGFNRTTASLLNSALFLVPLLALVTASTSLAGEKEDGQLALLLTHPASLWQLIAGKYAGMLISVGAAISFGFGLTGVLLFQLASFQASTYFLFFGFTILLAAMFLSIGFCVGMLAYTRIQAIGMSMLIWSGCVLFYEFGIIALLDIVGHQAALAVLTASVFLNPTELIRVWTIVLMDSASIFGPHLYELMTWSEGSAGLLMFGVSIISWMLLPLAGSYYLLNRGNRDV